MTSEQVVFQRGRHGVHEPDLAAHRQARFGVENLLLRQASLVQQRLDFNPRGNRARISLPGQCAACIRYRRAVEPIGHGIPHKRVLAGTSKSLAQHSKTHTGGGRYSSAIPVLGQAPPEASSRAGEAAGELMPTRKPVIAILEDDASLLRALGRLLWAYGYGVETYASA